MKRVSPLPPNLKTVYYDKALSYITSNPILFSSYFRVTFSAIGDTITPNALPNQPGSGTIPTLSLICEAAELPGRTFALAQQKTYGPTKKFPYMTTYNDITLSFICVGVKNEIIPKKFFEDWMEYINPQTNYNFKYKDDYVAKIYIEQFTSSGELMYKAAIIDAFPISISPQKLHAASQEQHTLQVTFTYTEFTPGVVTKDSAGNQLTTFNNYSLSSSIG